MIKFSVLYVSYVTGVRRVSATHPAPARPFPAPTQDVQYSNKINWTLVPQTQVPHPAVDYVISNRDHIARAITHHAIENSSEKIRTPDVIQRTTDNSV